MPQQNRTELDSWLDYFILFYVRKWQTMHYCVQTNVLHCRLLKVVPQAGLVKVSLGRILD